MTRIKGTLREALRAFTVMSQRIILRISNVSDKTFRECQKTFYFEVAFTSTHFVFSNFPTENRAVYEM